MKTKRVVCMLAVLSLIFCLCACSDSSEKNFGTYKLSKFMGMSLENAQALYEAGQGGESLEEMFVLTLEAGGKATFTVEGETSELDYEIEDDKLTLATQGDSIEGTIKNGVITLAVDEFEIELSKQ